ncbi:MAG: EamA family transporter [Acidimicrobiales bacterium]|nr:EamA family transporter [Acidimicrobiales bacterium]
MAIVLALGAAAFYGSADFMGGLATRRSAALTVAFGAQVSGVLVLLGGLALLGPATITGADLGFGALAGLFGGIGLILIYRALAAGPMSVVAPTSALSAASVPVLAGLLLGDRPEPLALTGIAISFVAVLLITWERTEPGVARRVSRRVVLAALAGGTLFGLFFVALHQADPNAGLWPLLAARAASLPVLAALLRRSGSALSSERGLMGTIVVSGALDMLANIFFLLATRHGMLAVVSALTGLYPATTVMLAQTRLGERMRGVQGAGLAVAALAAVMVAV